MKIGTYELSMPNIRHWSSEGMAYTNQVRREPYKRKQFKRGFIWLGLSLLGFVGYDPAINAAINSQLQLKDNGLVTGAWLDAPLPVNTCWHIFGIQNPWEFVSGAKPYMVDHGPFCYFMYRKRRVLEWRKQTVLYMERYEFEFNPEGSQDLDTRIQTVNTPILTGVLLAKNLLESFYLNFLGPIVYNGINMVLRATGEELVEVITARQLMEGRRMRIIEYVDMFLAPARWLGIDAPNFATGSMGIFNHSFGITTSIPFFELGPYEAYLKTEQGHTVGHIHQYEGRNSYPTFQYPCNRVAGGDGMFFSRPVEAEKLEVFVQHTCRILPFIRDFPHVYAGTQVVRYTMDRTMFDSSLPKNRCYCLNNRPLDECDGWADMSPCTLGLPIGLSYPYFLHSPKRQRELEGLTPDPKLHQGYLEIEDNLGAPIFASMKLQAVLAVEPVWSVPSLGSLPKVKLPIIWVDVAGGVEGALSAGMAVVSNTIRYGSFGCLLGGLAYSAALFRRGTRGPPPRRPTAEETQQKVQSIA